MGLRGGGLVPSQLVVYTCDPETYQSFYDQYLSMRYTSIDFYALPADAVA